LLAATGTLTLSAGCLRLTESDTTTAEPSEEADTAAQTDRQTQTAASTQTATGTPRTATQTTEPSGTQTTTAGASGTPGTDAGLDETYGGEVDDALWRVRRLAGGRYAAVGTTAAGENGGAWLLEVAADGSLEWERTLGETPDAVFYSVIEDADNDLIAAGTTIAGSEGDALLAKLDRGGNVLWERTQESGQSFFDVVQTDDGGYAAVGTTGRNDGDGYLNKWTASGEFVGENLYGDRDGTDRLLWCLQPSEGGLLFAGDTRAGSASSGRLVRTNRVGEVQWSESYSDTAISFLSQVIESSDGSYVAIGTKSGDDGDGLRGWLVRVDPGGSLRWEQTYSRNEAAILSGVTETTAGSFLAVGTTGSAGGGQNQGWAMRVGSRLGTPTGEVIFDEYDTSALYGVEQVGSDAFLTAGYARTDGSDNDGWLTTIPTDRLAAGDFDGWMESGNNYTGRVADRRGETEPTVVVGQGTDSNFAYDPAAIRVDPGTTVAWEWSGDGGGHSVTHAGSEFTSAVQTTGSFTHTFAEAGVYRYYCKPHTTLGMKGVVVVE
jgi:halocyanin-like protein